MIEDISKILEPIATDSPAGKDCRNEDLYQSLAAEIELMSSLNAPRLIDWNKVDDTAKNILETQSKDFLVAVWYGAGQIEKHGIDGLSVALTVLNAFFNQYWETAFPPVSRLRGRRNAIVWWLDRTTEWISTATVRPLSKEEYEQLVALVESFDQSFGEKDSESPNCAQLIRSIKALEVIEPKPEQTPAPLPQEVPKPTQDSAKTQGASTQTASSITPDAPSSLATSSLPAPTMKDAKTLASFEDVLQAMDPTRAYLGQLSEVVAKAAPGNPFAIHLMRFAARAHLQSLPTNKDNLTLIPAPSQTDLKMFSMVCEAKNAENIVSFCEARIVAFPFWFDLDHQSALGYAMMGEVGKKMAEAIVDELLSFLSRLPNIEKFTFSDKNFPFANSECLAWIETCQAQRRGGGATDEFSQIKKIADQFLGDGKVQESMQTYQHFVDHTRALRDQFRARLEMINLLFTSQSESDLLPLIEPLLETCRDNDLGRWEPALALRAWSYQAKAIQRKIDQLGPSPAVDLVKPLTILHTQSLTEISHIDMLIAAQQI
jgi:type VI secretion system protein VasJ